MRSLLATSIFALSALVSIPSAFAQTEKEDCGNATSTYEMNACADRDYQTADRELNSVYKKIVRDLSKDIKSNDPLVRDDAQERLKRLVTSQRAWLTYRDTNAQLVGVQTLGGTAETVVVVGAATEITNTRIKELNDLFGSK